MKTAADIRRERALLGTSRLPQGPWGPCKNTHPVTDSAARARRLARRAEDLARKAVGPLYRARHEGAREMLANRIGGAQ